MALSGVRKFNAFLQPWSRQAEGKLKARSRQGQGKVKSWQTQGKVKSTSRIGRGKVKTRQNLTVFGKDCNFSKESNKTNS